MRIGVIGAGMLAQAFAVRALDAGHAVTLSGSHGPERLSHVVASLGELARAGTKYEAAEEDIVVLAVPHSHVPVALADLGDWDGRTLVDATNELSQRAPLWPGVLSSSELVAELARGAHVIKALNTVPARTLADDPRAVPGYRRVLFLSGDDVPSKAALQSLLAQMGFAPIDLGGLAESARLQQVPGGMLAGLDLMVRDWGEGTAAAVSQSV
ncbi:NADPH-dependent F420 reductase [Leifsonia sp. LS-T14]|uniref:NADPH-dependent F420 reductase n=1 Tax=unclassified Leifsonia TaxID=2663824 RepID=UPI0035A7410F